MVGGGWVLGEGNLLNQLGHYVHLWTKISWALGLDSSWGTVLKWVGWFLVLV